MISYNQCTSLFGRHNRYNFDEPKRSVSASTNKDENTITLATVLEESDK